MIKDNNDEDEFYNYDENNDNEEETVNSKINIIDELINSLDIEDLDLKIEIDTDTNTETKEDIKDVKKEKEIKSKKSSNSIFNKEIDIVKSEYEIIMNCDDSDYIIYYKK